MDWIYLPTGINGDAPLLLQKVVNAVSIPIVSAGSIESIQRISEVTKTGAWGFTIGSALFDNKFLLMDLLLKIFRLLQIG